MSDLLSITLVDGSTWYSQSYYSELTGVDIPTLISRTNDECLEIIEPDDLSRFNPSEHFTQPGIIISGSDALLSHSVYKRWLSIDRS